MNIDALSPHSLTLGLVGFANLGLGSLIFWRYRGFRLLRMLAYNILCLAGYCVFVAGLSVIKPEADAKAWVRALVFVPHVTVLTFYQFSTILARAENRWTRMVFGLGATAFLVEVLARATGIVPIVLQYGGQGWLPVVDPFYNFVYLPTAFALLLSGWGMVAWRWKVTPDALEKQQLALFFVALGCLIGVLLIGLLPQGMVVATLAPLVYASILAYSITQRSLFDMSLLVRRSAVQAGAATVLACVFALALLLGRYAWAGDIPSHRFAAILTVLVMAVGYDTIKGWISQALNRVIGEQAPDLQEKLLDYALIGSASPRLDDLLQSTCRRLCSDLGLECAAVWVRDRDRALILAGSYPLDKAGLAPSPLADDTRLDALRSRPRGLDLDNLAWAHAYDGPHGLGPSPDDAALRDLLKKHGFHGAFPLVDAGQLVGSLMVGQVASGRPFKDADISFLSTLAVQLTTAVQNSALHRQVQQSGRLSALGTLSASLAHEIRNPLTSISTFVQMLGTRFADPVFREKFDRIVNQELEKLTRLTEQMLALGRPSASQREVGDLVALTERAIQLLHSQFSRKGVKLSLEALQGPVWAEVNDAELSQVMLNLMINALHATPSGGRVNIQATRSGELAQIRVRDTGVGMSPSQLSRLFEPFFTTKEGGTGLGLSTSHRIVEEHGGRIDVESAPDQGTCFILNFPAAASPAAGPSTQDAQGASHVETVGR